MKLKLLLACAMLGMILSPVNAQSEDNHPRGKAIINVFGNFHTGFGSSNDDRGFELDRSYLGYQYKFDKSIELKAVMDIGKSSDVDDLQRIAYIKNAQIKWTRGKFSLTGGLISTTAFKVQEDFWGYRYVKMSMQDYYKFSSSADLGISGAYQFADWISADLIVTNGEGYKKIQKNDGLQYGAGATIQPLKGLTLRLYGSINERSESSMEHSYVYAAFAGYKHEAFSLGVEYNRIENMNHIDNQHLDGLSVYTTFKVNKYINAFARYDNLFSKDDWNSAKDEATYLVGMEIRPCKYVKIAPNFRYHDPKSADGQKKYMGYISCYFGF